MKKVLIAVAVSLFSFAAGLIGFYFALPSVAPDRAEEARMHLDSLMAAADTTRLDSLQRMFAADSLNLPEAALDSVLLILGDTSVAPSLEVVEAARQQMAALRDSLRMREKSLHDAIIRADSIEKKLGEQLAKPKTQPEKKNEKQIDVADLSAALSKLEDKELRAILQQLDVASLETLYQKASGRNRVRLLQAMQPNQAARFVQNQLYPDAARRSPEPSEADSLARSGAQVPSG